jgi:hypothetical protein
MRYYGSHWERWWLAAGATTGMSADAPHRSEPSALTEAVAQAEAVARVAAGLAASLSPGSSVPMVVEAAGYPSGIEVKAAPAPIGHGGA